MYNLKLLQLQHTMYLQNLLALQLSTVTDFTWSYMIILSAVEYSDVD